MDWIGLAFLIGTAVGILVLAGSYLWWQKRRLNRAKQWPSVEALIESGAAETVANKEFGDIQLPVFAFSYQVAGGYYSGRFALLPYITDPGPGLIERMIGSKILVSYDPSHPESWFIPAELIEGCKVEQRIGLHISHDWSPQD